MSGDSELDDLPGIGDEIQLEGRSMRVLGVDTHGVQFAYEGWVYTVPLGAWPLMAAAQGVSADVESLMSGIVEVLDDIGSAATDARVKLLAVVDAVSNTDNAKG